MSVKARRQRTTKGNVPAPKNTASPKAVTAATSGPMETVKGTIDAKQATSATKPSKAAQSAAEKQPAITAPVTASVVSQPATPVTNIVPPIGNPTPLKGKPKAMAYAYGKIAQQFVADLASDVAIVACDGSDVELALAKAVELRHAGVPFFVAPLIPDQEANAALWGAMLTLEQLRDADEIRLCFEALALGSFMVGGKSLTEAARYPEAIIHSLRELHQMGDAVLLRSQTERNRLERMFQRSRAHVAICPTPRTNVPPVIADADADEIVVWAPDQTVANLAMHLYALAELKKSAIFICQDSLPSAAHRFATMKDAAQILKRAAVIIDADVSDPGIALAFAGRKMSVVSPRTNGAHESLQGVYSYDPTNFYSLFGAVSRARAGRRTTRRPQGNDAPILADILANALPVIPPNPPLVSIGVSTFNRRSELTRCLAAFSRQTYPNFEVIVVNDCGEAVDDIVARHPFARLVTTPENQGCVRALNFALSHAGGEYLGVLADDDLQYPDHITQLVSALVSSQLDVVHSDIVLRLETKLADGRYGTYGHLLIHDNDHDPVAAHWGGACTHGAGYLASRQAWDQVNYFRDDVVRASDIDSVLRFSREFDFGHVQAVTGEMSFRDDGTNESARAGRRLAFEVNDVMRAHAPNRRLIQERLAASVQGIAEAQDRQSFFLPWIRLANPIPVE